MSRKRYKQSKHWKAVSAALLMAGGIAVLSPSVQALAAPTYDNLPEGMTAEQLTRLNDNVIEWDEISDLITYWNPTYTRYMDSAMTSIDELQLGYRDFADEMHDQLEEVDDAIQNIRSAESLISAVPGNTVVYDGQVMSKNDALTALQTALDMANAGRSMLKSGLHSVRTGLSLNQREKSIEIRLAPLRNQMISVVQGLVISYKQLEVNRSMVARQVALYETLYATQQHLYSQNMATALDVQSYENRLAGARQTLSQIDVGLQQLKGNIALQCGYGPETDVVIADLPAPDAGFLAGRDYAADKNKAVTGNSAVIAAGRVTNYSSYGFDLRDMTENEALGKASANMDTLRGEVEKQTALYQTAAISLQRAAMQKDAAEREHRLGMLGRGEYEGLEMQYISVEATVQLAALNLAQAINNYTWAVEGIMSIE